MLHRGTFSVYSAEKTIDDTLQPFSDYDVFFYEANFHIFDNSCYYGSGINAKAEATPGSVLTFKNGNLKDFFFQNLVAGNNCRVAVTCTIPSKKTSQFLGVR